MSSIEPGTQVRIVIPGTLVDHDQDDFAIETPNAKVWVFETSDTDVYLVPIDPDRPTLDRETIARELLEQRYGPETARRAKLASGGWHRSERLNALREADAIITLIEAAHPGLIR